MIDPQVVLSYNFSGTLAEIIFVLVLFTIINIAFHIVVAIKQQKTISKQQSMLETKEEFISLMAAKQHEFNKHLQAISSLAQSAEIPEDMQSAELGDALGNYAVKQIKEYTEELIERNNSSTERILYVGDSLLSAYLTKKATEAHDKGIELSILIMDVADKLPCSRTETIEIIGNLLDNAIEAVDSMNSLDKKVFLEAHDDGEKIIIQTMNPMPKNISPGKELPVRRGTTTKKGKLRGHGLANIKVIAEKYKGSVQIYANGDVVTVVVALPV